MAPQGESPLSELRQAGMVRESMKDDVADFIAWLENPSDDEPAPELAVNADPPPAPVPVAGPELTQADIDRWMEDYDPQRDWQDDAASEAQLGYLQSLLRRRGMFLADGDAASLTKGQASHMIDLLRD